MKNKKHIDKVFKDIVCQPKKNQLSKIATELDKLGFSTRYTRGEYGGDSVLGYFDGEFSMGDLLESYQIISAEEFLTKIKSLNGN